MGMCYGFQRVTDEKLKSLENDPFLIFLYTGCDQDDSEELIQEYCEIVRATNQPRLTFWQLLLPWLRPEAKEIDVPIPEITWAENENVHGDIDKSWNLIHAGLTGKSTDGEWPLSFLMDYNHADYFSEEKEMCFGYSSGSVKEIAEAIRDIDDESLFKTLDTMPPSELKEVYRGEGWQENKESYIEYISEWFKELKAFVLDTADLGYGIIFEVF